MSDYEASMDTPLAQESAAAPESASPAPESVTPETSADDSGGEGATESPLEPSEPAPELSLREKIAKKAEEVAARRAKEEGRDPATGKFAKKPADSDVRIKPEPGVAQSAEEFRTGAKKPGEVPVEGAQPPAAGAYTPNYKLKVMEQEREIPEAFRSLLKDEKSEKEVREVFEKAYGLDYVKPKLEETRKQLGTVSTENNTIKAQINHARTLMSRRDIGGWLDFLQVPRQTMLQWVAEQLEYEGLPADQKANLDARKQAEQRAWQAEDSAASLRSQHEQNLTQQVQMALESCLARPDVAAVAKAYDQRLGKDGSFRAEVNRRGDYAWRSRNELVPPERLVQELMQILGPIGAPAATPAAPAATTPAPEAAPAAPAQPAAAAPAAPARTPVIPNISGRSASPLKERVKSVDDIRAKYKQMQDARKSGGA